MRLPLDEGRSEVTVPTFCRVCNKPTDHPTDQHNIVLDMRTIFLPVLVCGTPHDPIQLAYRHAREWQNHTMPVRDGERGGSSSPVEVEERVEDRRVAFQAARDERLLDELVPAFEAEIVLASYAGRVTPELAQVARRLAEVISRCVRVVDHDKLRTGPQGCRSCARKDTKRGFAGHFEPVSKRYENRGLCDQCGRFAGANKGKFPPIEYCDIMARQGKHAAGRWLARRKEKVTV